MLNDIDIDRTLIKRSAARVTPPVRHYANEKGNVENSRGHLRIPPSDMRIRPATEFPSNSTTLHENNNTHTI